MLLIIHIFLANDHTRAVILQNPGLCRKNIRLPSQFESQLLNRFMWQPVKLKSVIDHAKFFFRISIVSLCLRKVLLGIIVIKCDWWIVCRHDWIQRCLKFIIASGFSQIRSASFVETVELVQCSLMISILCIGYIIHCPEINMQGDCSQTLYTVNCQSIHCTCDIILYFK